MLRNVEASVAATGPTGVAYQIHHTVAAFHSTNASAAQPNMPHQPRRVAGCTEPIHNRGTKAASRVNPVPESQPGASRTTDRMTAANLRSMRGVFTATKVVKARHISKRIGRYSPRIGRRASPHRDASLPGRRSAKRPAALPLQPASAKQTPPQSRRTRRPHAPGSAAGRNHGSRTPDSPKKSYLCPYTRKPTLP